jgi:uncharacterized protein (TIGR03083 family)
VELRLDATKAALQLRGDGAAIVAAARSAGLDAAVPSCPDWTVADLLRHLVWVYSRATQVVRDGLQERPTPATPPDGDPTDEVERWHGELVTALRTNDLDRDVWTFLGPRPATWWSRRMAQESVIHRADAELAAGGRPPRVDAVVAVDGIDELLTVFLAEALPRLGSVGGSGESIGVHTPDERWHVTLHADKVDVVRGSDAPADALIAGTPSHVLYHLWGRMPADEVDERGAAEPRDALRRAIGQVTGA